MTKSFGSKIYIQQLERSSLALIEGFVSQMFSVAWLLKFFWVIMINNNWWLFWAHFNRACLIHPLGSATNTAMGKSIELSIDLKEHTIDLKKSLGAMLQVPRSTVQTTCTLVRPHCPPLNDALNMTAKQIKLFQLAVSIYMRNCSM